jgi:hypothetical protein
VVVGASFGVPIIELVLHQKNMYGCPVCTGCVVWC